MISGTLWFAVAESASWPDEMFVDWLRSKKPNGKWQRASGENLPGKSAKTGGGGGEWKDKD